MCVYKTKLQLTRVQYFQPNKWKINVICDSQVSLFGVVYWRQEFWRVSSLSLLSPKTLWLIRKHWQDSLFEEIPSLRTRIFITRLMIQFVYQGNTTSDHCWKITFSYLLSLCKASFQWIIQQHLPHYSITLEFIL